MPWFRFYRTGPFRGVQVRPYHLQLMTVAPDFDRVRRIAADLDERGPCGIDARGAEGVQIGNQGTQINYFYNGTWISGVAAAPLVSMSGAIGFPYRGLVAFEERDAGLFFGRETAVTPSQPRLRSRG